MKQTALETKILDLLQPVAHDLELEILYVQISGEDSGKTVLLTAETPETGRLSIDKCAQLSRAASVTLDVEDPIDEKYRLEVSSPGIDRLLFRRKDFNNYSDLDIKLETGIPLDNGQKRFRGILKGINDDDVITIATDDGDALIPFENVKKAKLVLTDELIKATAGK